MRLKRGSVRVTVRTPEMEAASGRLYLSQREEKQECSDLEMKLGYKRGTYVSS